MNVINCLDYGFVKLHNLAGPVRRAQIGVNDVLCTSPEDYLQTRPFDADDIDPAMSARMSFDNFDDATRTREMDLKLCDYLMSHRHSTPIEMIEVWLEMKLPIFLARQFVRHRTATINEVSARYVTLPEEWYIPEVIGGKATSNKQGQEDNLPANVQDYFKTTLAYMCRQSYSRYLEFIEHGIAPEHARLFLHVNHYTHWIWKQDLYNLMHFLALRLDKHAQIEARIYAQAIYDLLSQHLPNCMALFDKYRRIS
jgi:thymidylate synthase (FAD)